MASQLQTACRQNGNSKGRLEPEDLKEKGVLGCGAYPRTPCRPIFDRPLQDAVLCGVTPSGPISVEGKRPVVSVCAFKNRVNQCTCLAAFSDSTGYSPSVKFTQFAQIQTHCDSFYSGCAVGFRDTVTIWPYFFRLKIDRLQKFSIQIRRNCGGY